MLFRLTIPSCSRAIGAVGFLSIVDINKNREVERVKLGAYPRGIVVTPDSKSAYVAVMGSSDIAKVNLIDFSVEWLKNVWQCAASFDDRSQGKYLYATLNGEGKVWQKLT